MKGFLIVASFMLVVSSCMVRKHAVGKIKEERLIEVVTSLYIGPYLVPSNEGKSDKQLLIKYTSNGSWEYFSDPIAGFNHEAGYHYILKVKQFIKHDGGIEKNVLDKVVEKKKVLQDSNSLYDIFGVISIKGQRLRKDYPFVVELNPKRESFMAENPCTSFKGAFKYSNGEIGFSNIETKRKECINDDYENTVLELFNSIDVYFRYNNILLLIAKEETIFELRKID